MTPADRVLAALTAEVERQRAVLDQLGLDALTITIRFDRRSGRVRLVEFVPKAVWEV